jgi:sigma-B regulation protein RsbQ
MIGVLESLKAPERFESLILVGPSSRYIDDGNYVGGFTAAQIEELLESLPDNYMGWSAAMAP